MPRVIHKPNFIVQATINIKGFYDNDVLIDEEIQTEIARLEAEYEALQYQRDRASEYPSMGEQMDYIYHNGVEAWKSDMIDPIKSKYPKPE